MALGEIRKMNDYQEEMLRYIIDEKDMDGSRVLTLSHQDLMNLTFEADPDVEFAHAWQNINLN